MAETNHTMAMGWLPDFPDFRDYTVEQEEVKEPLKKAGVTKPLRRPPSPSTSGPGARRSRTS